MANNTPAYQGPGNPIAGNGDGLLGRFGRFFGGGGTPAYFGDGQPSSMSKGGFFGSSTPAYQPAPVISQPTENASTQNASYPVEPEPFGSGPITIIVPRPGC